VVKDSSRSVFVRNLPFEATYEDVASFFSQAGEVSMGTEASLVLCLVVL
jgi:RNA recognition motif-containing protein